MSRYRKAYLSFALVASVASSAALAASCSPGFTAATSAGHATGAGGNGAGSGTSGTGQGGDLLIDAGNDDPVVSVVITPANPVVEILNATLPPPITFTAAGTTKGGATVMLSGSWSFDRLDLASINQGSGAFAAKGLAGGVGTVTFDTGTGGVKGTTTVTVKLHYTSEPTVVDAGVKAQFPTAGTIDPSLALLYPYDKTVFPRGLTGPTIQWNGGGAADAYYIHAVSPTFELETWTKIAPPARYDIPADMWKKLTDSTTGDIAVSVQRHDGSQAYLPQTRTWRIANASLTGTIYFWEINSGNVVRLKPGDKAPQDFLQKPAGQTCVACHSVSKDGSRLVAAFAGGASPWGTFDAATGASLYNSGQPSGFEAISPNGSHVLWRHWTDASFNSAGHLSLSTYNDATELAQLNPGGGNPGHPCWAGDGTKIAFSVRTDGNGLNFNHSTLWVTTVDLLAASFANTHQIIAEDPARPTTTYPTFSPDSKWIAFERSTQSFSRGAQADVSMTSPDGSTILPLDAANGKGLLTGPEVSSTYEPTFMPVAAGGYFWLVIVSERTYGNTLVDTNPASRHKQLWVTAVDANPLPGQDPSHPAFWLPGQDINNNNMRGEWALSPCKKVGESCTAGYDCCGGHCYDDGMGTLTCSPPMMGCSKEGDACVTAADCCDPMATCTGGFCAHIIPH